MQERSDRFAAYAKTRPQQCKFAVAFEGLSAADKADVLEAMQKHDGETISRALQGEFGIKVSSNVVRRHIRKDCACVR